MLKVEKITKYYGNNLAVDNLSFTVKNGEIFGLLGSNGAGKTTTFRIIMGLLDSNSGSVTLDGKKIDYNLTDNIGFVTEERSLLTKMTVKEQIIYYGRLKGLTEEEILKRLDVWLEKFKITDYKNRKIKELSKGNQQKIQFIAAVINEPKLLILDEPFTGLDPINVGQLKEAIYELQKKGFCEKLVILVKGRTVLEGYLKNIKEDYKKKNIIIRGDFDKEILLSIKGVLEVKEKLDEYEVKIENNKIVEKVFKKISHHNITKFVVEEPSLNEIFIAKVGAQNE